jgi:hypothetical protein
MLAKLAAAVPEQRVTAVELVGLARSADAVLAAGAAGDVTTTRVAETRAALGVARSPRSLSRGWCRSLVSPSVAVKSVAVS